MNKKFENEKLLVVVSANNSIDVKIVGATLDSEGECLDDGQFTEDTWTLDVEPGLYAWEGTITFGNGFQSYKGEMRPANAGDLGFFGLRDLAPEPLRAINPDALAKALAEEPEDWGDEPTAEPALGGGREPN